MSKSSLDPATAVAFRTPGMSYESALETAQRTHQTVEHVQQAHAANVFIQNGSTPAAAKLNAEKSRLQNALQKVEADQADQSALIQEWEGLLKARDTMKMRISNASAELEMISAEIPGRIAYVHQACIGQPQAQHGHPIAYANLLGIVAGLERAQIEVTKWLESARVEYASQLEKVTAFAQQHHIDATSN